MKNKGFTLVEILIVVVILGILAAIVIPQFSEASTEARLNSLSSNLQTVRSQLSLYRIQHNDQWPAEADFTDLMTGRSDQDGTVNAAGAFGPYLQAIPTNPFTGAASLDGSADWLYDEATGAFNAVDHTGGAGVNGVDVTKL